MCFVFKKTQNVNERIFKNVIMRVWSIYLIIWICNLFNNLAETGTRLIRCNVYGYACLIQFFNQAA